MWKFSYSFLLLVFISCENQKHDNTQSDFKNTFIKYFNENKNSLTASKPATGEVGCEVTNVIIADLNNDHYNDAIIEYTLTGDYGNIVIGNQGIVINNNGKLEGRILEANFHGAGIEIQKVDTNGIVTLIRREYGADDSNVSGPSIAFTEEYKFLKDNLVLFNRLSMDDNGSIKSYESTPEKGAYNLKAEEKWVAYWSEFVKAINNHDSNTIVRLSSPKFELVGDAGWTIQSWITEYLNNKDSYQRIKDAISNGTHDYEYVEDTKERVTGHDRGYNMFFVYKDEQWKFGGIMGD